MANNIPTAFILAAGYGRRLANITQDTPKALVTINNTPTIAIILKRLAVAGIKECVINLHHFKEQIINELGDGSKFGIKIKYSQEDEILNVAGGIANALDLISSDEFIVTNVDIYSEYDFKNLITNKLNLPSQNAHLVLGNNPHYHPNGDYSLSNNLITPKSVDSLTYIGIARYHKSFFSSLKANTNAPIQPLWEAAMAKNAITGEYFEGFWLDIGEPQRLELANKLASNS